MTSGNETARAIGVAETGIGRVAVIGAGSMGSGIAAQFANAGLPVILLDIPGKDDAARNAPADAGVARQVKARGFMGTGGPGRVTTGNIDDDLALLAEADWIVEAIVEKIELKRALYARIDAVRKAGSIVSSNTSTIQRSELIEGQSPAFARDFLITHFFNPPRVMQLVEIVTGPENAPGLGARVSGLCETLLGKTPVVCRDTPGFIANRIGCFWMAAAAIEALRQGLTVEEADAVHGAFGIPRTGVFGLFDLIGIDLVPQIWSKLMATLPHGDSLHDYDLPSNPVFRRLIEEGRFGRKSGAGFYRRLADGSREALDLASGDYRPLQPVAPDSLPGRGRDLAAMLDDPGRLGKYAWSVFSAVLGYTSAVGPDIAGTAEDVDTAIALGYAWRHGPFALGEAYGATRVLNRMETEGRAVPDLLRAASRAGNFASAEGGFGATGTPAGVTDRVSIAGLRAAGSPMVSTPGASLWDMGDGIACFEIHTKMNTFAPEVQDALAQTVDMLGGKVRALVLGNDDARAFSAGADLNFILGMVRAGEMKTLDTYVSRSQTLFQAMKYAPAPVVAAMHGYALGGGCEFALHADAIVAHAELTAGLPEPKVGLVPGWGGCTLLLLRALEGESGPKGPVAAARRAFDVLFPPRLSGSAEEARELGLLRPGDGIVMHRAHLLGAARDRARALLEAGYTAPETAQIPLSGASGRSALLAGPRADHAAGRITDTDLGVAELIADVLTGGTEAVAGSMVGEAEMLAAEREALLTLSARETTLARMEHMLKTGKPLRN